MLKGRRGHPWGIAMKKVVLAAALLAAASVATASAADRNCYSPADIEAEQALLFQTNLMVISSACRDTVYGEFRARNTAAILRYQNAMIEHFRRTGARNPKLIRPPTMGRSFFTT